MQHWYSAKRRSIAEEQDNRLLHLFYGGKGIIVKKSVIYLRVSLFEIEGRMNVETVG